MQASVSIIVNLLLYNKHSKIRIYFDTVANAFLFNLLPKNSVDHSVCTSLIYISVSEYGFCSHMGAAALLYISHLMWKITIYYKN